MIEDRHTTHTHTHIHVRARARSRSGDFLEAFLLFRRLLRIASFKYIRSSTSLYRRGQSNCSCVYGYGYVSNTVIDYNISKTVLYLWIGIISSYCRAGSPGNNGSQKCSYSDKMACRAERSCNCAVNVIKQLQTM